MVGGDRHGPTVRGDLEGRGDRRAALLEGHRPGDALRVDGLVEGEEGDDVHDDARGRGGRERELDGGARVVRPRARRELGLPDDLCVQGEQAEPGDRRTRDGAAVGVDKSRECPTLQAHPDPGSGEEFDAAPRAHAEANLVVRVSRVPGQAQHPCQKRPRAPTVKFLQRALDTIFFPELIEVRTKIG